MTEYLFVYGSLRKNPQGELHPYLQDHSQFLDYATLPGLLYVVDTYPGAVPAAADSLSLIHGELYLLYNPSYTLPLLDAYEECTSRHPQPHEFARSPALIYRQGKPNITAWVYWYNHSVKHLKVIASGDFL
jgi:gamma-glutamylcyclotransferase (GGCT)/AIG2-like uncharacterized protein YtfP